tara:strand:- start:67 stop:267 length:201 start_codon:yes stop_codon:yes gene_type:complete
MELYDKKDIIRENEHYVFFDNALFNKAQLRFLIIYQHKKKGKYCMYKDYDNIESKKRLFYILPNQN